MSRILSSFALIFVSSICWSGPIAAQFGSGYGGIPWGMSLVDLVGVLPGGEHFFATTAGERDYAVENNESLVGVPRTGMKVQYGLGKDNRVEVIAVNVPYERRDQLLDALVIAFGSFKGKFTKGTSTTYYWAVDDGIQISLRASVVSSYGILQFGISRATFNPPPARPRVSPAN